MTGAKNRTETPRKRDPLSMVRALRELAQSAYEEHEFEDALAWVLEALKIAEELNKPDLVADCLDFAAANQVELGRPEEAIALAERSRVIWLELGHMRAVADTDGTIAAALQTAGRQDEAIAKLKNARAIFMEIGHVGAAWVYEKAIEIYKTGRRV